MPKLSLEQRARIIGQLEAGVSAKEITCIFNVHKTSVYRLKEKFDRDGTVKRRKGSGRPRKTSVHQDEDIVRLHEEDRFRIPAETASDLNLGSNTIKRRLKESGMKARKAAIKPRLKVQHRVARMQWAIEHRRWTLADWSNVLFTDEASFSLSKRDNRVFCYRRTHERYLDSTVRETINRGYGCVSVWGAIINDRKLPLVRVEGRMTGQVYVDTILENNVIPFVRDNPNVIFQQDNAPPHSAGVTAQYLTDQDITVLEWPAVSPDMNCVENVWALLSRAIRKHRPQPQTHDELFNILSAEWERIPAAVVYSHTSSMYRRVNALWRVDGGFTKY